MSCSLLPVSSTFKTRTNQTHGFGSVSCNASPNDHNRDKLILPNIDRRNLLLRLAGLCTTANLPCPTAAVASPITTPDITSICNDDETVSVVQNTVRPRRCCPPKIGKKIKPFQFPKEVTVRMRWPAHRGTPEQVIEYRTAVQAMKDLPEDHPHSFSSQAKVHCAYCNGHYSQTASGFPLSNIHIHNSWLFFPFHRWHLYFHERILAKLINKPSFALPYWKWDEPPGMSIPDIFLAEKINDMPNPLYDSYRNAKHVRESIVDLEYDVKDKDVSKEAQIACNLSTVYRDLVRNGGDTLSFFGGEYDAGDTPIPHKDPSIGSLESGSHNSVHRWVGDTRTPNHEDMGAFYSAGYDPLFYAHHANIDRLWKVWKELDLPGHTEPKKNDWLNASYVFYDENQELVRVYNKDSIDLKKLNYNYIENSNESVELYPWRNNRPLKRSKIIKNAKFLTTDRISFPLRLKEALKVCVKRPVVRRTKREKENAHEVLLIKRIKFDSGKFVKFDVFVNDNAKDGVPTPCGREYAGGFAQIPHNGKKNMFTYSSARFGLDELLEDTNSEGGEYATVMLVPKAGCQDLTIGEIKIVLVRS